MTNNSRPIALRGAVPGSGFDYGNARLRARRAQLLDGKAPKGGIREPARLAGVMAAKRTAELIPLCHPLGLDAVDVDVDPAEDGTPRLRVRCRATTSARTGVEMEAMTGAAVAALTLYDMAKALDKGIRISGLRLLSKSGGKSGRWQAE